MNATLDCWSTNASHLCDRQCEKMVIYKLPSWFAFRLCANNPGNLHITCNINIHYIHTLDDSTSSGVAAGDFVPQILFQWVYCPCTNRVIV